MLSHTYTRRLYAGIVACATLLTPMSAFAIALPGVANVNSGIGSAVVFLLTILNLLTWLMFGLLNFLLDPAFMFALDANGNSAFMDMLNQIWQLARDLTNVAFAVVLVIGAVYTIATASKDMISKHARSFVMAIILVNFSWFIPRVVLDVSNIATAAIFGIPSLIGNSGANACEYSSNSPQEFCTEDPNRRGTYQCPCVVITDVKMFVDANTVNQLKANNWKCPAGELMCYQSERLQPGTVAGFSTILNGLIINHGRLRELGQVPRRLAGAQDISAVVIFIMREMIVILMQLALFLPLLAMAFAFAVRIPILWITIAFMPFYALKFVLSDSITEGWPEKIKNNFLKAAFLPAKVAIPLAIGFVMINAGSHLDNMNPAQNLTVNIFPGVGNLWQLLWMCMSVAVLWMGVFNVLKDGPGPIAKVSETIKKGGQSMASGAVGATVGNIKVPLPQVLGGQQRLSDVAKRFGDGNPFNDGRGGDLPPARANNAAIDTAATRLAGDNRAVTDLTRSIQNLTTQVRANNPAQATAAMKAINTSMGGEVVGHSDPVANMERMLERIRATRPGGAAAPDSAEITALTAAITDFRGADRGAAAGMYTTLPRRP